MAVWFGNTVDSTDFYSSSCHYLVQNLYTVLNTLEGGLYLFIEMHIYNIFWSTTQVDLWMMKMASVPDMALNHQTQLKYPKRLYGLGGSSPHGDSP